MAGFGVTARSGVRISGGRGESYSGYPHEFKLHNLVSELVSIFGAGSNKIANVDELVTTLNKNRTPYITTQVSAHTAKRKIVEYTDQREEFLKKYDELKIRQARNLDPLVYLLSKITDDKEMLSSLSRVYGPEKEDVEDRSNVKVLNVVDGITVQLPEQGEVMSREQVMLLRGQLSKLTTIAQDHEKEKLKQTVEETGVPQLPSWVHKREYLSSDFTLAKGGVTDEGAGGVALKSLPVAIQEKAVIQDFLYLMNGVNGRFISSNQLPIVPKDGIGGTFAGHRTFSVDDSLDPALNSLVDRLLPLAVDYSTVAGFLDHTISYSHGLVNQALAGAMRGVVKEYRLVSAQLETEHRHGDLSLQKLWFYVQPSLDTMSLLARVATAVAKGKCRGGKTLSALHKLTGSYSGDARSQQVSLHLTSAACGPYFEMLGGWVFRGEVRDPYREFMVVEDVSMVKDRLRVEYNDTYWELRYTVNQDNIPTFLEQLAEKILRTGKYLNVMSECGGSGMDYHGDRQLSYHQEEGGYTNTIHSAYAFASESLLELVMKKEDLLGHLRSIKHYFLVDQGDLLVHFMDMAREELTKPVGEILPQRLESLLELALRTSLADHDPYKDNVCTKLWQFDLVSQLVFIIAIQPQMLGKEPPSAVDRPHGDGTSLSGVEAFCLDYKVKWPLSLVISRKCLYRYQMLFRHLFYCRHVERELCSTWTTCKSAKASALDCNSWYPSAFSLLQRMLNYVQNLQYYVTCEVLEPMWAGLETSLRSASTIDDVILLHNDFLDVCLRDCLLSNREVLIITSRLLDICLSFTRHIQTARGHKVTHTSAKSGRSRLLSEEVVPGSVADMVGSCEQNFKSELVKLLDWLYNRGPPEVRGMVARLDFNGFYQDLYRVRDSLATPTS